MTAANVDVPHMQQALASGSNGGSYGSVSPPDLEKAGKVAGREAELEAIMDGSTGRPLLCEFLGTFIMCFTVGCCSVTGNAEWTATAVAAIMIACIYSLAPVSDAIFNPAVGIAFVVAEKKTWSTFVMSSAMQLLAAVTAGLVFTAVLFKESLVEKHVVLGPKAGFALDTSCSVEFVYSFMIIFIVLNCAFASRNNSADDENQAVGLALGFAIIASALAGGTISGGVYNPAVTLCLSVPSFHASDVAAYISTQLAAGVCAGFFFKLFRSEDYEALPDGRRAPGLATRITSELLGTYFLVLTMCLCTITKSVESAWATGAVLLSLIYSLRDVSGAHFNPAVTLAVMLSRRGIIPLELGGAQVLAQVTGALAAAAHAAWLHSGGGHADTTFALGPGTSYRASSAELLELIFTCAWCYVFLAMTTEDARLTRRNFYVGLAIGMCVAAGGFATGAVSGGLLNPAASLGLALLDSFSPGKRQSHAGPFAYLPEFVGCEFVGGALASLLFYLTHAKEYQKKTTAKSSAGLRIRRTIN